MINASIFISKLNIIRKKKDGTFRQYTLHLLKFQQFSFIVGFRFFLGCVYVGPLEYMAGRIFGLLAVS